jgi:hypothetical protein
LEKRLGESAWLSKLAWRGWLKTTVGRDVEDVRRRLPEELT